MLEQVGALVWLVCAGASSVNGQVVQRSQGKDTVRRSGSAHAV